jgi:hypothetical protein
MTQYNFNITWPIADTLFGTTYLPPIQDAKVGRQRVA